MSLFSKFQIPSRTPAKVANPANLEGKRGKISNFSNFSNLVPVQGKEAREVLELSPDPQIGITAEDVLSEFPEARVVTAGVEKDCSGGDSPRNGRVCRLLPGPSQGYRPDIGPCRVDSRMPRLPCPGGPRNFGAGLELGKGAASRIVPGHKG